MQCLNWIAYVHGAKLPPPASVDRIIRMAKRAHRKLTQLSIAVVALPQVALAVLIWRRSQRAVASMPLLLYLGFLQSGVVLWCIARDASSSSARVQFTEEPSPAPPSAARTALSGQPGSHASNGCCCAAAEAFPFGCGTFAGANLSYRYFARAVKARVYLSFGPS